MAAVPSAVDALPSLAHAGSGEAAELPTAAAPTLPSLPNSPAPDERRAASGLRRRLLVLLMVPLGLLALLSVYLDYRAAGTVAALYDQQLQRVLPQLANSIVGPGPAVGEPPLVLMAPALAEFLRERGNFAGYRISTPSGALLQGEAWIPPIQPLTSEPEFHSAEQGGTVYRIAAQRVYTSAGEFVVQVADGSDPRQQWWRSVLIRVLLPNLVVVLAAAAAISWAVRRALRPLHNLKDALEQRSPRDLSALESERAPEEVRPLILALNRLFALVSDQAESQRRFVADAAHQLRTPLAGLQAQVEAWSEQAGRVQHGAATGTIALPVQDLQRLRSATRRTSQLANQLLALSRADSQAMQSQPMQWVDLKALCEETLTTHLDGATAKQIDLGLDAMPARVLGHHWLLSELLANLTDNAIKYSPDGGAVTVRCGVLQGRAYVGVEDDGPGIPPQEQRRVTERFYRSPGSAGDGNGLGLAIAFEIARLHHATWVLANAKDFPDTPGRPGLRVGLWFAPPSLDS